MAPSNMGIIFYEYKITFNYFLLEPQHYLCYYNIKLYNNKFIKMSTSALLTQYPLSPKKLWKKVSEKVILFAFISLFLGVISIVLKSVINNNDAALIYSSSHLGSLITSLFLRCLIPFIILTAIYLVYIKYYIKTYFYEDEGDFLTIRKGVFMPAEIHVQYLKMQDVYVDQDILDRILGIYDVHISSATYTSEMAAHIDGVSKESADGLKKLFLNNIKSKTYGHRTVDSSGENNVVESGTEVDKKDVSIHLEENISSDNPIYKLSSEWWTGELVKIALGSLFIPMIGTLWLGGISSDILSKTLGLRSSFFYIWLIVLIIYILSSLIKLFLWKGNYEYKFTDQYIYMKEGIISVSEKNLPYNSIQDVSVKQGIVDRIFGVADVNIENASAGANISPLMQGRNQKYISNGIVIEGLSLEHARHITSILKEIIIKRPNMRGL